jgi:C1A family cysteine protease
LFAGGLLQNSRKAALALRDGDHAGRRAPAPTVAARQAARWGRRPFGRMFVMARIRMGLGWKRDLPDPRDLLFSAPLSVLQALPSKYEVTTNFPIYDQGRIGSCTAQALAAAVEYGRMKAHQTPAFTPSRLFIYYNERDIEGDVPVDAGAYLRDGIKALQKLGVCDEELWAYDDTPPPAPGAPFPPNARGGARPTAACYAAAAQHQIVSYQRLNQTLSQLQGCLVSGYPFVFGFTVFNSWYATKPKVVPLPHNGEPPIGGHAVLCVGYDNATGLFKFRNSWGAAQGDQGYFYMPYAYLLSPNLAADLWTIRTVEG